MKPWLLQLLAALVLVGSLVSCRPDPVIIEVPVPFAIDSLALLPKWESHPAFLGGGKKQWISWADDSLCLLLGADESSSLKSDASILTGWNGANLLSRHSNEDYRPDLRRHWMFTQDVNQNVLRFGHPVLQQMRTFFSLNENPQSQQLSFISRQSWQPMSHAGVLITATPNEFSWVGWARDSLNQLGLLYITGTLASIPGNPRVDRVEWHPLPIPTSSNPGILTKMGEAALLAVANSYDSTAFFGERLFFWQPDQGYEQIPFDCYGSVNLRTAFAALDGEKAYLMVGEGDLFEVGADGTFELKFSSINVSRLAAGKDLRSYVAFYSNRNLSLLEKSTGKLWVAPNFGLDGHNISDVTLFKDTLILSSRTGGIFYQALSDVWPEDER